MVQPKFMMKKNVRILLVGERGVGKTSLILSLVGEEFPEDVPPKAEEITIPADVTPEQVPTHIVDYSAVEQTDEQLAEEVQRAHVICVVYSVEDEESLEKITTRWLPFIKSSLPENVTCPIILVGNKVDLVDYTTIDAMIDIMNKFPEIESCVECSAKTLKNISEMFYYAQKAVLHPTSPLYLMESQDLTPDCKKALTRIFKICDLDNDGLLNDNELNAFQKRCFNGPLKPQILEDVKSLIRKNINDGIEKNCITLNGFIFLHCLFIQRGRNETTWTVLRKFGYDDKLNMAKEYLFPQINIPSGCTTELSYKGQKFFTTLFERHDKDKDGALNPSEVADLFSTCPAAAWGADIRRTVPTTKKNKWITLNGFLCQWMLITLYDIPRTLEYLAYFGYNIVENESQLSAIHITREKKLDIAKRQTSRNVYQCHVIGPKDSGKSMFCLGHLGYTTEDTANVLHEIEMESQCTINVVHVYGQEKYLVLRDVDLRDISDPLSPMEIQCDVVCLIYNVSNPKSFEFVAQIYLKYFEESKIPVLIVGSKADLPEVRQDYTMQPEVFCSRHKLPPPQPFTAIGRVQKEVYVKLATMAAFPSFQAAWVMFCRKQTRHLQQLGFPSLDSQLLWKAGVGLVAVTAVGYFIIKMIKSETGGR
ncbi:UNVERIFIED_CONTAM: hypothetical protein PYX00_005304 [Menopon gallinae]|uniref:Mitochondrial Rho GTPase n=1 Tax=Menopon gallinae TaxID=328185 RepID=A0AAW2HQJ6_9NEOP